MARGRQERRTVYSALILPVPACVRGKKGIIVTELAFYGSIVTECEACCGKRYNEEALACDTKEKIS